MSRPWPCCVDFEDKPGFIGQLFYVRYRHEKLGVYITCSAIEPVIGNRLKADGIVTTSMLSDL